MTEQTFNVGKVSDFAEDSMTPLELSGNEILLVKQAGAFYALPDQCTHARFPLHDGELLEGKVKCQYHGATFDLESGRATLPAIKKIQLYHVLTADGEVFVTLQES